MSQDLLFEIGTEELPSSFILPALGELEKKMGEALVEWKVEGDVSTSGTPRRMALMVRGLPEVTPRRSETVTGPPARAAFRDGAPTKAAIGFARSRGVDVAALRIVETPKGDYVAADVSQGGEAIADLLTELLPSVALGLHFRKSMRWGANEARFGRPIRWVVALFGGEVLPIELMGVRAGRVTAGLRYAGPREMTVSSIDDYLGQLAEAGIQVDPSARRDAIWDALVAGADELGGVAQLDEALLSDVAGLVESPGVVAGRFNEEYLSLPDAVPVTVMKHHQRYFPVYQKEGGALMNAFLQVTNNPCANSALVSQGNERVLAARLSDGHFFWREDLKTPLPERLPRLEGIIFHAKLGSIAQKVERMRTLGRYLAEAAGLGAKEVAHADRAAHLSKADLVTWMVGEFPELQGLMGREYARRGGEPDAVAVAIEEHYLPKEAGGALPASPVGAVVAVADKLDSIVAFHGIGKGPTGAADPYALRRAALGTLRILMHQGWPVTLSAAVSEAMTALGERVRVPNEEVHAAVLTFMRTRLKGLLIGEGIPTDLVEAVLSAGYDDVGDAALRARALAEMARSDDFSSLMIAFKRAVNISRKEADAGPKATARLSGHGAQLREALEAAAAAVSGAVQRRDYPAALESLLTLKAPIDAFFDNVMVMDPDPMVREARLAVLHRVAALFQGIADFSRLGA